MSDNYSVWLRSSQCGTGDKVCCLYHRLVILLTIKDVGRTANHSSRCVEQLSITCSDNEIITHELQNILTFCLRKIQARTDPRPTDRPTKSNV